MKYPRIQSVLLIFALLVRPLSAADSPAAAIPTPLKSGQEIILFPEGVPGAKAIGPEVVSGTTYSNISNPRLIVNLPPAGMANGTSVIYCPGGGYVHVAIGSVNGGVIGGLNNLGVTVFTLLYRCKEFGQPAPQQDVLRAVRTVRAHAADFGINPDRIGVLGGSSGAHVAASAGTLFNDPIGKTTNAALDAVSARPDFMILIFPVLTMEPPYAHGQSRDNLLGPNPSQDLLDKFSLEKQVTKDTPPTFLVHTQADHTVSEQNTLMFYEALVHAGVPAEMHLYAKGPHGSGMDPNLGTTAIWPKLCEEWMRDHGWLPPSPTSLLKNQRQAAATNPPG